MGNHKFKIGTDPEVFLTTQDGEYRSAHDLIPGTKENPYRVKDGAIQVDGVAMEFNTNPAETAVEFMTNIKSVMQSLEKHYKRAAPDLLLTITPTANFEKGYFDTLPDEPKLLGCTPDFNAYTGSENTPPETTEPFRTGAGHIHVGWGEYLRVNTDAHFQLCRDMVKQLDAILYISSLLWDSDDKRRTLYGKIGAFRPKVYGVEYRPLSNAFLSRPFFQKYIFEASVSAADLLMNQGVKLYNDDYAESIVEEIRGGENPKEDEIRAYLRYLNARYQTPLFV